MSTAISSSRPCRRRAHVCSTRRCKEVRFISTAGRTSPVTLTEALLEGPAPDGGLFVPERLEPLTAEDLGLLELQPLTGIAAILGDRLYGSEVPGRELAALFEDALDFPIPLTQIEPGIHCLELFHGPTLAFKDVASRVMARLMARFAMDAGAEMTVIVATSGDTGSAVAHAFAGVAGLRVCVLYPNGLVTEAQRRLFTTLGGNVTAVAVDGTFDDCQSLARDAFADGELRQQRPLASANSINIGRLLPQVFYYFHAWAQLPSPPLDDTGEPLVFSTPSGNFGNLTAGLIAKRIGLPVSRFVAATNVNDVVPAYLRSGDYLPRGSVATISNAMDVGNPSNFARIVHLYSSGGEPLERIRRDVAGHTFDDDATRRAMREVHDRTGYLLDPHTAVGYLGLKAELEAQGGGTGVVLATAHPAKFAETVQATTGIEPPA
ncbi:MAG: threonine synthase, partial [Holophagales bacterium]|nr:threonine synthase [Holophagales bacterium]